MIYCLKGRVEHIQEQQLILNSGFCSFELHVPCATQWKLHDDITLFVHMHWSQETGPALYGFVTQSEKQLFLLIISCSGIGPRLALALLAHLGVTAFVQAIQQEDDRVLSKVSGVGPRKAEQLVVHLRHKVAQLVTDAPCFDTQKNNDWHLVSQTLESLKYSRLEIARAISHVRTTCTENATSFDQLVKTALVYLARQP